MSADLKSAILTALAGSSSQQPVDVAMLYKLGDKASVQAALLEMYRDREVYCCLYQRGDDQATSVWWLVGGVSAPHSFGRQSAPKVATGQTI